MSFDWSEYLNLAKDLAGQEATPPSEEAKLRSSISRAYYACFNLGKNYLVRKYSYTYPSTGDAHEKVRRDFSRASDVYRRTDRVATNLLRLRDNRNLSDYEATVADLSKLAEMSIVMAEATASIIMDLSKHLR